MIWIIPNFIEWQKERLIENGMPDDDYSALYNKFYNVCERILGLP